MKHSLYFLPAAAVIAGVILWGDRLTRLLIPFVLAAILSAILSPPTEYLRQRTRLKAGGAALVAIAGFLLLLALLVMALAPVLMDSLRDVVNSSGDLSGRVEGAVGGFNVSLQRLLRIDPDSDLSFWMNQTAQTLCHRLFDTFESWAEGLLRRFVESYAQIFAAVFDGVTAVVITFYLLRDGTQLRAWALDAFPFSWREPLSGIFNDLGKIFSDFLQGQLFISLVLGVIQTAGLLLLGIPYAPVLGFFGGILNIVPYFGPFIGAVPAVLAAFFVSPWKAIWTAALYIVLQQIDNNWLSPKIVEGRLGVHPVATIVTVFLGGEFFGLWGVLLSVPVYAALRAVLRRVFPIKRQPV